MKPQLEALLQSAVQSLKSEGIIAEDTKITINLDRTKNKDHGDLACNVAMMLAKAAKMAPRALAEKIVAAIPSNDIVRQCDIAGPGFDGTVRAGVGDDVFTLAVPNGRTGEVTLVGETGADTLEVTGGGLGYSSSYEINSDGLASLEYRH